jgi:tetratricopeptide (TPR) repeat protein
MTAGRSIRSRSGASGCQSATLYSGARGADRAVHRDIRGSMRGMGNVGRGLGDAREAASRYAWGEAFDLLAAADAAEPLGPDDLERMAECAWWIGKMRHCIALRERAHAAFLKAGDVRRAARVAVDLGDHHADLMEVSAASAWIQKATRLLEQEPEGAEHGWLALIEGLMARGDGDLEKVRSRSAEAASIAARHGDRDLFALAHASQGLVLTFQGDTERGLQMVEEATVGAVSGELGPRATGWIYCMMITVNAHLADWQRAGQWTEAATRWCDRQAINGFPGVCRVHRAEIMRLRGQLTEAEEEARTATAELGSFNLMFAAEACRELGEVRLKMGELDAAEEAFRQASEMGVTPQPGLALALVQRGRPQVAASSLRRALADKSLGPLERGKLLPAQLEVALLLDDLETARSAAVELEAIASSHASLALRATSAAAAAAVGLAEGSLESAARAAEEARRLYQEVDLAYEAARVSLLLGQIHQACDEPELARAEISSALETFEAMGAVPDAARARQLLAATDPARTP